MIRYLSNSGQNKLVQKQEKLKFLNDLFFNSKWLVYICIVVYFYNIIYIRIIFTFFLLFLLNLIFIENHLNPKILFVPISIF